MSFAEFPLSKGDCTFLIQRAKTHTLPQTLLVEGGDAQSRHALAAELARAIVCQSADSAPCGQCSACRKAASGNQPDIAFYAPEKPGATFKVEVCRAIRQDAFLVPNDGLYKVYVLEDSQMMNDSSENALLKILEEPPAGVYFVLTCTSRSAMLPTILSRAVVLHIIGEDAPFTEETKETAHRIAMCFAADQEWELLKATAPLEKNRDEMKQVLLCLCGILKDALLLKSGAQAACADREASAQLAQSLSKAKIYAAYQTSQSLVQAAQRNANANLLVTGICYRLKAAIE